MNILITSVGRRGYLVNYFKEVMGKDGEVHVSNSSELSPAFSYADATVVTPLIYDDNYINFLLTYCRKNSISVILPVFDIDLLVLAKHKQEFEDIGVKVIVSDPGIIEICNDKWETFRFLRNNGFFTPKTYIDLDKVIEDIIRGNIEYPLILKPRWGMGSLSIYVAEDEEELKVFYRKIEKQIEETYLKYESENTVGKNVLMQEKIEGQEYGLDIINDLNGCFQTSIVKKKYTMRAGETDCAMTVKSDILENYGKKLGECLKHIGNLDVDIFMADNIPYVLEMNARFGGGYPFSHVAGVDLPRTIISWIKEEKVNPEWLKANYNVISHKDIQIKII